MMLPTEQLGSASDSPWLRTSANKTPLRVGLLLDGPVLSRFSARIIADLQAANFVDLALLVYRKPSAAPAPRKPKSKLGSIVHRLSDPKLRKHTLYQLYLRVDRRKKLHNDPLENVDCSALLAGIESLEVEPAGERFVHRFPPDAIKQIRDKQLDVLIRFGFNILKGEILTAARYGVWSYHHGDNEFYRGWPPHF